jgi:hypothetical protein
MSQYSESHTPYATHQWTDASVMAYVDFQRENEKIILAQVTELEKMRDDIATQDRWIVDLRWIFGDDVEPHTQLAKDRQNYFAAYIASSLDVKIRMAINLEKRRLAAEAAVIAAKIELAATQGDMYY